MAGCDSGMQAQQAWRPVWRKLDTRGRGSLTFKEFPVLLRQLSVNLTEDEIEKAVARIQRWQASRILLQGFLRWWTGDAGLDRISSECEARGTVRDLRAAQSDLANQLEKETLRADSSAKELNRVQEQANAEHARAARETLAALSHRDEAQAAVACLKSKLNHLNGDFEEAQRNIERLEQDIDHALQAAKQCMSDRDDAKTESNSLRDEVTKLQNQLLAAETRIREVLRDCDTAVEAKQESLREIDILQGKVASQSTEFASAMQKLVNENNTLREHLSEANRVMANTKEAYRVATGERLRAMSSGLIWRQVSLLLERAACYRMHIAPTRIQASWRGRLARTCVGSQPIIPFGEASEISANRHLVDLALMSEKSNGDHFNGQHLKKKEEIELEDVKHEHSSVASLGYARVVLSPDDVQVNEPRTSKISSGVMCKSTTDAISHGRAAGECPGLSVIAETSGSSNESEFSEDDPGPRRHASNSIYETDCSECHDYATVSYMQPVDADLHFEQRSREYIAQEECRPLQTEEVSSPPQVQSCQPEKEGAWGQSNWTVERQLGLRASLVDQTKSGERDETVKAIDIREHSYDYPNKEEDPEDENVYDFDLDVMESESVIEVDNIHSFAVPDAAEVCDRVSSKNMENELVNQVGKHCSFELALPNIVEVRERDKSRRHDEDCEKLASSHENGDSGDMKAGINLSPNPLPLGSDLEPESALTRRQVDALKEPLCLQKRESRLRPSLKRGVSSGHRSDAFRARRVSLGLEGATSRRVVCFNSDDPPSVVGSTPDEPPEESYPHESPAFSFPPTYHDQCANFSVPSTSAVQCSIQGRKFGDHDTTEYEHEDIYEFYSFDSEDYEEDCDFEGDNVDEDVSKLCACQRI